jgi:YD repeat-containing protein
LKIFNASVMKKNLLVLLVASLLLVLQVPVRGQSKKEIREKGIKTITVEEYFLEEGINEPVVESVEIYNEEGELVEIKELNRRGEVNRWEKYKYDEDGNRVEEIFLDEKGRVERIERTLYEDGLKVEKQYFNEREKMYKKKVFVYEYAK